jgi:hypothetical protein
MNTDDLERLKGKEDAAVKIIDIWPRIFQLLVYRQLYAFVSESAISILRLRKN